MMICARKRCESEAIYYPVLLLYIQDRQEAIKLNFSLATCAEHTKALSLQDLVFDESWDHIVEAVRAVTGQPPLREKTQLAWIRIDKTPPDVQDFGRTQ